MNERITEILTSVAVETLDHLAFVFYSPEETNSKVQPKLKSASVSFTGPFSGRLVMKMSTRTVLELTANMLGVDEAEVSFEQQSDAVKEALNVICGNLLPAIAGNYAVFNINTPQMPSEENNEGKNLENEDSNRSVAVSKLSIDDEPCEFYLFIDGDSSS